MNQSFPSPILRTDDDGIAVLTINAQHAMNVLSEGIISALSATCSAMMLRVVRLPQPVIAEVKGIATAAGCRVVASCDLAVASEDSTSAISGDNIGEYCSPPMVAVSCNIPRKMAVAMLLLVEFLPAARTAGMGLLNRVVPRGKLETTSMDMARTIPKKSPAAVRVGERAFYKPAEKPLEEAFAYGSQVMAEYMKARDAEAGIGAFTREEPMPGRTGQ